MDHWTLHTAQMKATLTYISKPLSAIHFPAVVLKGDLYLVYLTDRRQAGRALRRVPVPVVVVFIFFFA